MDELFLTNTADSDNHRRRRSLCHTSREEQPRMPILNDVTSYVCDNILCNRCEPAITVSNGKYCTEHLV